MSINISENYIGKIHFWFNIVEHFKTECKIFYEPIFKLTIIFFV